MSLSPSRLLFIDQFFFLPYRVLEAIFEKTVKIHPRESGEVVVIKLFGKGSLIHLLNLSTELNTDINSVLLITSEEQRDVCEWMGIKKVAYIKTGNLFSLFKSSLTIIREASKIPVKTVISLERCSYAVNSFALILSIRSQSKNLCFEASRNVLTKGRTIYSAQELSIAEIFKKCLAEVPVNPNGKADEIATVDNNKIIVNINASELLPARRYSRNNFVELIKMLNRIKPQLNFFLTGSQRENEYVQYIADQLADINITNVAGQWSLQDLAQEISSAAFVLTNDSMPLHMAALLGVPVVGLWGPTQPQHFGYHEHPNIFSVSLNLSCSPCFIHPASRPMAHCRGKIDCLTRLKPEYILSTCLTLLRDPEEHRAVRFLPSKIDKKKIA